MLGKRERGKREGGGTESLEGEVGVAVVVQLTDQRKTNQEKKKKRQNILFFLYSREANYDQPSTT